MTTEQVKEVLLSLYKSGVDPYGAVQVLKAAGASSDSVREAVDELLVEIEQLED